MELLGVSTVSIVWGGQELSRDASSHSMSGASMGKDIFLACPFFFEFSGDLRVFSNCEGVSPG